MAAEPSASDAPGRGATAPESAGTSHPGISGCPDVSEGRTALRQRYAEAIRASASPGLSVQGATDAVLAVRDDELTALRAEVQRMTLARNCANAMKGVHKRSADRLRAELEQATAALAGDNEGGHQWMLTCTRVAERRREQVDHWQRKAEQAEATNERAKALHSRDDSSPHGSWCGTCTTSWPCRTWTALDQPTTPEADRD